MTDGMNEKGKKRTWKNERKDINEKERKKYDKLKNKEIN